MSTRIGYVHSNDHDDVRKDNKKIIEEEIQMSLEYKFSVGDSVIAPALPWNPERSSEKIGVVEFRCLHQEGFIDYAVRFPDNSLEIHYQNSLKPSN